MQLPSYFSELTGISVSKLFDPVNPLISMMRVGPTLEITYWDKSLPVAQPTSATIIAVQSEPELPATLISYAATKQQAFLSLGQIFNVAVAGAAEVLILSDGLGSTLGTLASFAIFGQANPTGTRNWLDNNGITTVLSGAQCVTLNTLVSTWANDVYIAMSNLITSISATSPTVTTMAQIDALAWPTS